MRTRIEVGDLTAHQWDWLTQHLPEPQPFGPGAVRMCVTFTLDVAGTEIDVRHSEMSARDFINLIAQLQLMDAQSAILEAATEPVKSVAQTRPRLSLADLLHPGAGL